MNARAEEAYRQYKPLLFSIAYRMLGRSLHGIRAGRTRVDRKRRHTWCQDGCVVAFYTSIATVRPG